MSCNELENVILNDILALRTENFKQAGSWGKHHVGVSYRSLWDGKIIILNNVARKDYDREYRPSSSERLSLALEEMRKKLNLRVNLITYIKS